jgi:hypothetical protein
MSEPQEKEDIKTPWHLWCVGVFALLWSSMGALDYLMTQTRNQDYMSNFSSEQLEFFYNFPTLIVACWAIAVWGGVLGALLLLLRKQLAAWVFLISLLAMLGTTIHNYVFSNGLQVAGDTFSLVFTATIFLLALLFVIYSMRMRARGILI